MCDGGGDSFWIRKQQQQQQQSIDIFFFLSRPKKWIYLIYTYRHTKQKLDFKKKGGAFTGWVSFFLLSWIVWSLISLPWKPNQTFYLFYFLLMFNRKKKKKQRGDVDGFCFCLTLPSSFFRLIAALWQRARLEYPSALSSSRPTIVFFFKFYYLLFLLPFFYSLASTPTLISIAFSGTFNLKCFFLNDSFRFGYKGFFVVVRLVIIDTHVYVSKRLT